MKRREIRGGPSDDEVAAIVAVLTALAGGHPPTAAPAPENGWSARWRGLRPPLTPGADAWRLSVRR